MSLRDFVKLSFLEIYVFLESIVKCFYAFVRIKFIHFIIRWFLRLWINLFISTFIFVSFKILEIIKYSKKSFLATLKDKITLSLHGSFTLEVRTQILLTMKWINLRMRSYFRVCILFDDVFWHDENRTHNQLIKNQVLYRLSYVSLFIND